MKFKSGDIIRGTEGDGKTWGNTTTLLLLHVDGPENVSAVVLRSVDLNDGEITRRRGDTGKWSLLCRDWEKIGSEPHLEPLDDIITACIARHTAEQEVRHAL